ncbi:serine protease SP24D-like [Drosophila eugracilis]|uniref:serine protease SP24D-like n=1 Tax=Drosophila eugracilis TaxID=29029 RepID=UPI0007E6D51C|nr:serine protease SP24D-like [Drosophila eugracilis]
MRTSQVAALTTLLASCLLLLVLPVQSAPGSLNARVVGGEDAAKAQFPHQVSLRNAGSHSCGGSILSKNYILTAAHCVTNQDANGNHIAIAADRFTIRAGSNDRFSGGVLVQVAKVIVHEEYGNFLNDVALLLLETPLILSTSIQPISLPTSDTPADADIIISGWGRIKHQGDLPRYLQYNTLKSISLERCDELIGWGVQSELCLIHEADNGACNGDSGGPAIYNNQVVGVAGFVWSACGTSYPDGYARVYFHNDWIRKNSDVK